MDLQEDADQPFHPVGIDPTTPVQVLAMDHTRQQPWTGTLTHSATMTKTWLVDQLIN